MESSERHRTSTRLRAVSIGLVLAAALLAACRADHGTSASSTAALRGRVRQAFAASPEVAALLDRLAARGCPVEPAAIARWQVGVTREDDAFGGAMLEAFACGDAMGVLILTAAGPYAPEAELVVSGAAAVRGLPGATDSDASTLLVHDSDGVLREVPLTADVAAEIETALAASPETEGAATASLLGAADLEEFMGACALVLSDVAPNPALAENENNCADCLANTALCLGVVNRLAEAEGRCMQLLYCSETDRADLGLARVPASTLGRWFGGQSPDAVCPGLTADLADADGMAECRAYYDQTGATMRAWVRPVDSGCGAGGFFDYGSTRTWSPGCFGGVSRSTVHLGNDCMGNSGTEVRAVAPGRVVSSGANYTCGQVVVVEHTLTEAERGALAGMPSTLYSHYGHVVPSVREGDFVEAGDRIGTIAQYASSDSGTGDPVISCNGGEGNSHLHWEVLTHAPNSFVCSGDRRRVVSPGYFWAGPDGTVGTADDLPAARSGWYNPEETIGVLLDANLDEPEGGFLESMGAVGRASLSGSAIEGFRQLAFLRRVTGALAGLFGSTDLTAARSAGYFVRFAILAWHRHGLMGEGPGTQFYCATMWEDRFSCHPPLCFDGADTMTDAPCFAFDVTCADPSVTCADRVTAEELPVALGALAPTADLGATGCCEAQLRASAALDIATLSPTPDATAPPVPEGTWNRGFTFYPRASMPDELCGYVVFGPFDEGTYMPSAVRGAAVMTRDWTCPAP